MKFILKRTVKHYEHRQIDAKNFKQALEIGMGFLEEHSSEWENSQLGEDCYLEQIENAETGEERSVDEERKI